MRSRCGQNPLVDTARGRYYTGKQGEKLSLRLSVSPSGRQPQPTTHDNTQTIAFGSSESDRLTDTFASRQEYRTIFLGVAPIIFTQGS